MKHTRIATLAHPDVLTPRRIAVALGAAFAAAPALAQDDAFDLENWDYDAVYSGWSAEELVDKAKVYGEDGEEIGSIENLLMDDQGQIVALIAQVGGLWDIGDTHVAVPWDQATFEGYNVRIPVNEDNVGEYSLFSDSYFTRFDIGSLQEVDDDLGTGLGIWKATDLINDYAVLESGSGYGYINDLVFDDGGKLQAVVVNADGYYAGNGHYGYYAYPWYGYGYPDYSWDPGRDRYVLPFDENEISDFTTAFDYEALDGDLG